MKLFAAELKLEKERSVDFQRQIAFTLWCHMLASKKYFGENVVAQYFQIVVVPDEYGENIDINEQQATLIEFYCDNHQKYLQDLQCFMNAGFSFQLYGKTLRKIKRKLSTLFVAAPKFGFQIDEKYLRYIFKF